MRSLGAVCVGTLLALSPIPGMASSTTDAILQGMRQGDKPAPAVNYHEPVARPAAASTDNAIGEWFYLSDPCESANTCKPGATARVAMRIAMGASGNTGYLSSAAGGWWVHLDFSRIFSPEKMEQIRQQCEQDLPCVGHATVKVIAPLPGTLAMRAILIDFN